MKIKQAPVIGSKNVTGKNFIGSAAKVYFTKKLMRKVSSKFTSS